MSKTLEVKNLRISFKVSEGTVKAVRDISFDLEKGETLCIVGESGSGKSVTAKAILGILAGNSIVEGGEIIYRGDDLLKYTERDFEKIRGNLITMIFQDPLSSLNPIMRIGKQMTEATILNGRTNRKNAKKDYTTKLDQIAGAMKAAGCPAQQVQEHMRRFKAMAKTGSALESAYHLARDYADSACLSIDQMLVDVHENDPKLMQPEFRELDEKIEKCYDPYLLTKEDKAFAALLSQLHEAQEKYDGKDGEALTQALLAVQSALRAALDASVPDFFGLGYYTLYGDKNALSGKNTDQLNALVGPYLDEQFMNGFLADLAKALRYNAGQVIPWKEKTVTALRQALPGFQQEKLEKSACESASKELCHLVDKSIDRLSLRQNTKATTFRTTMEKNLRRYFDGVVNNPKELRREKRQSAKLERAAARRSDVGKVTPAVLVDLDLTRRNITSAMEELASSYEQELAAGPETDHDVQAREMVAALRAMSFTMTNKVSKQAAYDKAIRIMEDVGIKEPRKRFKQYPFEFSGGMRQRIVIAIAVAANPDILICDEPTTALDVTIQAQILELINDLKKKRNISVIFITHDLGVVANMADRVAVMYAGKIVEFGTARDIFYHPAHPYTWALLASMPDLDTKEKLEAIQGTPPNMIYPPKGDAFAERNENALAIDFEREPPMFQISDTHWAATWLLHPKAPKIDPPKSVTDRIRRMRDREEAAANG